MNSCPSSCWEMSLLNFVFSVQLDDLVPLRNRPDPIGLNIWGWALPVPCLHRNLPGLTIVGFNVVNCFTGHVDFHVCKLCPTQCELGKQVPAAKQGQAGSIRPSNQLLCMPSWRRVSPFLLSRFGGESWHLFSIFSALLSSFGVYTLIFLFSSASIWRGANPIHKLQRWEKILPNQLKQNPGLVSKLRRSLQRWEYTKIRQIEVSPGTF